MRVFDAPTVRVNDIVAILKHESPRHIEASVAIDVQVNGCSRLSARGRPGFEPGSDPILQRSLPVDEEAFVQFLATAHHDAKRLGRRRRVRGLYRLASHY